MNRDSRGKFTKGDQNQGTPDEEREEHTFISLLNRPPSTLIIIIIILLAWTISFHGNTMKTEIQRTICPIDNDTSNVTPIINDTPAKPKEK